MISDIAAKAWHNAVMAELKWWDEATPEQMAERLRRDLVVAEKRLVYLEEKLRTVEDYWRSSTEYAIQTCNDDIVRLKERIKYHDRGGRTLMQMAKDVTV